MEAEALVYDTLTNYRIVASFRRLATSRVSTKTARQYVYVQAKAVADELNHLHGAWSDA
jgi:hypothetical protein